MTTRSYISILVLGVAGWPVAEASAAQKPEARPATQRPAPAGPATPTGLFRLTPLGVGDIPSLAGDELVLVNGQTMTAATLRARMASARSEAEARLEGRRARFEEAELARRYAANASAMAVIERLRARPPVPVSTERQHALVAEARQLLERYPGAGEKEREEIERRAGEILGALLEPRRFDSVPGHQPRQ